MPETINEDKALSWLSKSDMEVETEAFVCATQEQAFGLSYDIHRMDGWLNPMYIGNMELGMKQFTSSYSTRMQSSD